MLSGRAPDSTDFRWQIPCIVLGSIGGAMLFALAAQLVWYGSFVCVDLPFVDDWKFIERLKAFVAGDIGWTYFFEPHNGHPSLFDRVGIYAAWKLASLNLATLRWCALILMLVTAALLGWQLFTDLRRQQASDRWSPGEAILLAVPVCALALSLGQWEFFSAAVSVDAVADNLFPVMAIFFLDRWYSSGGRLTLTAAILFAVLASRTQLQGILVWPVLGVLVVLNPKHSQFLSMLAIVVIGFLAFASMNLVGVTSHSSFVFNPLSLFLGNLIIVGVSYLAHIDNRAVMRADIVFGCLVWILTALAIWLYFVSAADTRARMNKYIALIVFGFGTSLMIEIGRLAFSLEYLTASRYGAEVMPWAWGLSGVLALSIRSTKLGAAVFSAHTTIIVIGVGISNIEEARMAISRQGSNQNMIQALREGKILNDNDAMRRTFLVGDQYVDVIPPMREYLLTNKLSLFRPGS
jgi:hypothetical protein